MSLAQTEKYYLPQPSLWPIVGSIALFLMAVGGVMAMREIDNGGWVLLAGFAVLFYMMFGWFGEVIRDSEAGRYNKQVDASFRWSMSWFIFSEVMFFAAFFGALFYTRVLSVPWLGEGDTMQQLWPEFKATWPTAGPGLTQDGFQFTPMGAWGIPAINTLLLLSSGVTVTWAHWGLKKNSRTQLIVGLALTVLLGVVFLGLQAYEYHHAYSEMGLTLGAGVYGSTFFLLTGFHGFHVLVGTTMLLVMLLRAIAGHFSADHHFAFEAVSWYWHFVDVVWVILFIMVYWMI
ncbi:MAG TPA: cytochrome c oxidase subunit 3 [Thiobacillus sp.]|nr:MAG: cytochrome c oxidase subunit 3 [Hydrogenophilales bacterium 28-61-11]OYZ58472.1 MAG: cytochrome c oxidase subunit 3 [Hydrogenophilales bacterium 16-61-112]OZA49325.1 MAG: cytochrome c oxidase subunit 3 [Hydrogenophilales bacterium 17-61-76]HQT31866.1 cytochrome c oxidase subunit 3 [Thiobacillus sp.]HQT69698.1 cytochrome c oxidase subunit 3 [Thiobacillus sp.]